MVANPFRDDTNPSAHVLGCQRSLYGSNTYGARVVLGAVLDTQVVWQLSEIANGLMAIPNLICLAALTGELRRITKEYKKSGASGSCRWR